MKEYEQIEKIKEEAYERQATCIFITAAVIIIVSTFIILFAQNNIEEKGSNRGYQKALSDFKVVERKSNE